MTSKDRRGRTKMARPRHCGGGAQLFLEVVLEADRGDRSVLVILVESALLTRVVMLRLVTDIGKFCVHQPTIGKTVLSRYIPLRMLRSVAEKPKTTIPLMDRIAALAAARE